MPLDGGPSILTATISDLAGNGTTLNSEFEVEDNIEPVLTNITSDRKAFSPEHNPYEPPDRKKLKISFESSKDVNLLVTVNRVDGGASVRTYSFPNLLKGMNMIEFDGKLESGLPLRPGFYTLELQAIDNKGNSSILHSLNVKIYF
jgi:hypothetical protein